jgi:hypothetical protein
MICQSYWKMYHWQSTNVVHAWWRSGTFQPRCARCSQYPDRWIGRGGPTAWPPRSPDLDPLDFYLWGHLKSLVYAAPVDNEEALHHRTVDAVRLSATAPASLCVCGGPWWDLSRRALNHMEDILSAYYKCTLSAITRKLNVSGHMLIWTFVLVLVCGTRVQSLSAPFSYTLHTCTDLFYVATGLPSDHSI